MRIAYVTTHFPDGPGERFFEPEVLTLSQLGAELLVIPARPRKRSPRDGESYLRVLRLRPFDLKTAGLAAVETLSNPVRVFRALRTLCSARCKFATKIKNLVLFPKALAVGRILRRMHIEHIHAQWLSTPSTVAYVASAITGIPWSCTAHRFDILQDNLIAQKTQTARFIRAISSRNRDLILQKSPSAASRCAVIHLGVAVPRTAKGSYDHNTPRILCAANLVPVKGHRYLLEALAALRDRGIPFECDLAGEGPLRQAIQSQIERSNLSGRVRLRGVVDHERLCGELASGKYDLFVLASTEDAGEFEGIPVALMEAMAAGIPCVSTSTGSIAELIEDGVSSTLVPQRDSAALAGAMELLLRDARRRAEMGKLARDRIVGSFNTQSTSKELFDLIRGSSVPA